MAVRPRIDLKRFSYVLRHAPRTGGPTHRVCPRSRIVAGMKRKLVRDRWGVVLVAFVVSVIGQALMAAASNGISFYVIGVSQLLYLCPLMLFYASRRNHEAVWTLAGFGGVVFLVNSSCMGVVAIMVSNM